MSKKRQRIRELATALLTDDVDAVRALLDKGIDANITCDEEDAETPLMLAHSVEMVRLLLEHGTDVDARDGYGRTALRAPGSEAGLAIFQMLLKAGADINTGTTKMKLY